MKKGDKRAERASDSLSRVDYLLMFSIDSIAVRVIVD